MKLEVEDKKNLDHWYVSNKKEPWKDCKFIVPNNDNINKSPDEDTMEPKNIYFYQQQNQDTDAMEWHYKFKGSETIIRNGKIEVDKKNRQDIINSLNNNDFSDNKKQQVMRATTYMQHNQYNLLQLALINASLGVYLGFVVSCSAMVKAAQKSKYPKILGPIARGIDKTVGTILGTVSNVLFTVTQDLLKIPVISHIISLITKVGTWMLKNPKTALFIATMMVAAVLIPGSPLVAAAAQGLSVMAGWGPIATIITGFKAAATLHALAAAVGVLGGVAYAGMRLFPRIRQAFGKSAKEALDNSIKDSKKTIKALQKNTTKLHTEEEKNIYNRKINQETHKIVKAMLKENINLNLQCATYEDRINKVEMEGNYVLRNSNNADDNKEEILVDKGDKEIAVINNVENSVVIHNKQSGKNLSNKDIEAIAQLVCFLSDNKKDNIIVIDNTSDNPKDTIDLIAAIHKQHANNAHKIHITDLTKLLHKASKGQQRKDIIKLCAVGRTPKQLADYINNAAENIVDQKIKNKIKFIVGKVDLLKKSVTVYDVKDKKKGANNIGKKNEKKNKNKNEKKFVLKKTDNIIILEQ